MKYWIPICYLIMFWMFVCLPIYGIACFLGLFSPSEDQQILLLSSWIFGMILVKTPWWEIWDIIWE